MASNSDRSEIEDPEIVQVSQKGQATIPKTLREKYGIEAPGEVFIYDDDGRIFIEPVPTMEELGGIHAGDHEPGEVEAKVRELRAEETEHEETDAERLSPDE